MDTIKHYQDLIKQGLSEYAELLTQFPPPPYQVVKIFDDEHQQYALRQIGWHEKKHYSHTVLHVAIKNDKIWIEEDWTEEGIATFFLEHNVPAQAIVLSFYPPEMRALSAFAAA